MLSVNTNTGALVALQYLNQTQASLNTTQSAINSGLKVASAKDDGATYAIAQSSMKQKDFFDKAVQELNRTYTQGRTDIKTLIDLMNSYFASEVQLSRAIGDYQIALNELAASRDELIADPQQEKK